MATQLHQVLAAEASVVGQDKAIYRETEHLFDKNPAVFQGNLQITKTTYAVADEVIPPEVKATNVVTTVSQRLQYTLESWTKATDLLLTKEETNASGKARADLVIGGKTYSLAATSLIQLAKRLVAIKELLEKAPVRAASKPWVPDTDNAIPGVFRTETVISPRITTRKEMQAIPGTMSDKHPAQTAPFERTINLGTIENTSFSGELTASSKAILLDRITKLITAVDKARSLANSAEIADTHLGEDISKFLLDGI